MNVYVNLYFICLKTLMLKGFCFLRKEKDGWKCRKIIYEYKST